MVYFEPESFAFRATDKPFMGMSPMMCYGLAAVIPLVIYLAVVLMKKPEWAYEAGVDGVEKKMKTGKVAGIAIVIALAGAAAMMGVYRMLPEGEEAPPVSEYGSV